MSKNRRARRSTPYIWAAFFLAGAILGAYFFIPTQNMDKNNPASFSGNSSGQVNNSTEEQPSDPAPDKELQNILETWANEKDGDYGIVVRELDGIRRYGSYQGDKVFIPASTYKLFVVYGVLHWVENGSLSIDTTVVGGKDVMACIDSLLLVSSDECAWPMGQLIGWPRLNDFLQEQGFKNTDINNYDEGGRFIKEKSSTAADKAEFVWRLANGKLLNDEYTELMLSKMKQQIWRQRIPAGVPEGIVVADKPGWLYDLENDTAIVYGKNSNYVVSIISDGAGIDNVAGLSRVIYNYLNDSE